MTPRRLLRTADPQLPLPIPRGRGGWRPGAGRKPKGERAGVPHVPRPPHAARHPVHVTLRARPVLPSLRHTRLFPALRAALAAASKPTFRLVQFSVQADHLHLVVEARDREALIRGVQGLAVRTARAVNRALGRRGRVWGDRYHARALRTPREVRSALVYVLNNYRKHGHGAGGTGVDRCSSAPWFDGWRGWRRFPPPDEVSPVAAPRTWLARDGWRRHGLIRVDERPKTPPRSAGGFGGRTATLPWHRGERGRGRPAVHR